VEFGFQWSSGQSKRANLPTIAYSFAQIVIIIVLLVISAHHKSTSDPQISEWAACSKPLGAWDAVWVVKLIFDCGLVYWSYLRDRLIRLASAS
jgi:hypothetical protein